MVGRMEAKSFGIRLIIHQGDLMSIFPLLAIPQSPNLLLISTLQ
jgi:hypothetical protein